MSNEKAQLYRRIVQETDDQSLLERMRLHGFWRSDEPIPIDPPDEAGERQHLESELKKLRQTNSAVRNPFKELSKERKRRWDESKKRRTENKKKRAEELQRRREAWEEKRKTNAVHLGVGVSAGLQNATSDVDALNLRGLPVMHNGNDVAARMGIRLSALRWLTYHRKGAAVVHYHRFEIAKKTGGARCISAPKPALAHAQRWILENILEKLEVEACVHGFRRGHSIVSNATPHTNKNIVINLDIKDFFPSVTFRRVKGLFHALGYSEHVAVILALLCTEPPRVAAEVDGKTWYVALGERVLPQGACTSPAITNVLCRRLDRRLQGLANKHEFAYTRYADDLTFSGGSARPVGRLLRSIRSILNGEGFVEHPSKSRVMRPSRRQEVTGLTVNQRPTVSRKEIRQLRAILHNAGKHGLQSQNRNGRPDFAAWLRGRVEYVCMVDPLRAPKLRSLLQTALQRG